MGTLTGKQIKTLILTNNLFIDPFEETMVQPATYDLRVHHKVLASPLGEDTLGKVVDLREEAFKILPGQMVGVLSFERLEIPLDMSARFGIRSSFARKGINAFGGIQLDPGFQGRLIMNLINVGPEPVELIHKQPIFSVEFNRLEEKADSYCGEYQNQDDFPADQYNYILQAHTTSLAEIPSLRKSVNRLNVLLEDFGDMLPDPDTGLELNPEIEKLLRECSIANKSSLLTTDQMQESIDC